MMRKRNVHYCLIRNPNWSLLVMCNKIRSQRPCSVPWKWLKNTLPVYFSTSLSLHNSNSHMYYNFSWHYLQYFIIFIQNWCIWSGSTNEADAFCVRCKLHSTFCAYCITRIEHSGSCKQNTRVLKLFHTKCKWTGSYFITHFPIPNFSDI